MRTSDFDFNVPPELISHEPARLRDHCRLMVLNRAKQTIEHRHFYDLPDYLQPGDLLVLNNTKVMPANLIGKKEKGGAKVEVLLVNKKREKGQGLGEKAVWKCLVKPGKRLKVGSRVVFGNNEVLGAVLEKTESGEQVIEFEGDLQKFMREKGKIPLPPYINSPSRLPSLNKGGGGHSFGFAGGELEKMYQTVYAEREGAAAAPTAGLHFTPELLGKAKAKGIRVAYVTLHTGLATFKPVYAENVEDHKMYSEEYEVPAETAEAVKGAKRVVAVGTTSVRTLETIAELLPKREGEKSSVPAGGELKGSANLFIYPGYEFRRVDAMVTNFHWPRTTLIMMVSAFAGRDFVFRAYGEAIDKKYRFFSFGDAMLIV